HQLASRKRDERVQTAAVEEVPEHLVKIPSGALMHAEWTSLFVSDHAPAVHDVRARIDPKCRSDRVQRPRYERVVGVHIVEVRAGAPGEALVNRVALAAVALADPRGQPRLVLPNDFDTAVRRAAVDHDVLEVAVTLKKN